MKTDLDQLMQDAGLDALLIFGPASHNAAITSATSAVQRFVLIITHSFRNGVERNAGFVTSPALLARRSVLFITRSFYNGVGKTAGPVWSLSVAVARGATADGACSPQPGAGNRCNGMGSVSRPSSSHASASGFFTMRRVLPE